LLNIKKGFTLIELVFVIVIIGILASIAIPKFWATRDDAIVTKGRSEVSTIRSAIMADRQRRILKGESSFRSSLDDGAINMENEELFDGNSTDPLLEYPIYSKNFQGHWMKVGSNKYVYILSEGNVTFNYDSSNGKFDCNHSNSLCILLTQ